MPLRPHPRPEAALTRPPEGVYRDLFGILAGRPTLEQRQQVARMYGLPVPEPAPKRKKVNPKVRPPRARGVYKRLFGLTTGRPTRAMREEVERLGLDKPKPPRPVKPPKPPKPPKVKAQKPPRAPRMPRVRTPRVKAAVDTKAARVAPSRAGSVHGAAPPGDETRVPADPWFVARVLHGRDCDCRYCWENHRGYRS